MQKLQLEKIFQDIFPRYGMNIRIEQEKIANFMLQGLNQGKISICEAGVGTGKTYAYLLASIVYKNQSIKHKTVLVSTSSISLQQAIVTEYLPKLSKMLEYDFTFRVLKGKKHYICDKRLEVLRSTRKNEPSKSGDSIELNRLSDNEGIVDLDELELRTYLKEKICVENCSKACNFHEICRYQRFLKGCKSNEIDFLIVNHNYFVADVLGRSRYERSLLPNYNIAILDEAHKLGGVLLDMYRFALTIEEIEDFVQHIEQKIKHKTKELIQSCDKLKNHNNALFVYLQNTEKAGKRSFLQINSSGYTRLTNLKKMIDKLCDTLKNSYGRQRKVVYFITYEGENISRKLGELQHLSRWITWLETPETLSFLPLRDGENFLHDFWEHRIPTILTSGTMSVNGNYDFFLKSSGISSQKDRISILKTDSPFNYKENALLYIPKKMPFPNIVESEYRSRIQDEIVKLIRATHGHTLILFTSYQQMNSVYRSVSNEIAEFPLLMMGKGDINSIEGFRKQKNAVLFASDAAGEGIDLVGDVLSSVIVVKLPFPIPSPVSDYTSYKMESIEKFKEEIVVPAMITKLRQWFGRGIRNETDICVFSILDSRATYKYNQTILNSLPTMPVTDRVSEVRKFIKHKKGRDYFG